MSKKREQEPRLYQYGNRFLSADDILGELFQVAETSKTGYIRVPVPQVEEERDTSDVELLVEYDYSTSGTDQAEQRRSGLLGRLFGR